MSQQGLTNSLSLDLDTTTSATNTAADVIKQAVVHAQDQISTDVGLFTLFMAASAFVFLDPQIYGHVDFYRRCFSSKVRGCFSVFGPPSIIAFRWIDKLMRVLLTAAIIFFAWNFSGAVSPSTAYDVYISAIVFLSAIVALRYFWADLFWNWHNYKLAMGLTVFLQLVHFAFHIVALGLLGKAAADADSSVIHYPWTAFALLFFPTLWSFFTLIWNVYIFYCFYCGCTAQATDCDMPALKPHYHCKPAKQQPCVPQQKCKPKQHKQYC
jgi:hypothetical protein